jgi:hypothetical protein
VAVRSKRLWGPTAVSTLPITLYTSPDGETTLIKCLTLVNNAIVQNVVLFRVNNDLALSNLQAWTIPGSGSVLERDTFIVLQPGESIRAVATQSATVSCGFGAQLEGVAD